MGGDYLTELHASLDQRWRPEDVLRVVLDGDPYALPPTVAARVRASMGRRPSWWSSMSSDFARPVGGQQVLASVERAFQASAPAVDADDPDALLAAAEQLGEALCWSPSAEAGGASTHLTREQRAAAGVELSRRQYNRQWRALRRLHRKAGALATERVKRELAVIGRSGFVARITVEQFRDDPAAAHFVAYWVARKNLRREFSLSGKSNPMDEVAEALLARCVADSATDWQMVALARPTPDVLARLSGEQQGDLLAQWMLVLRQAAALLESVWDSEIDRTAMIVRRGQDSSTWNTVAQAYNTARSSWLACVSALGAEAVLDAACPGKVMRLMAADLAYWHRLSGGDVDENTAVWAGLPLPWEVLDGRATSTRSDVEAVCRSLGVDPEKTGWTAPRAAGRTAAFALTPELVHGVTIADPVWAGLLRRAGVFSGKHITADRELAGHASAGVVGGVVVSDLPTRLDVPDGW